MDRELFEFAARLMKLRANHPVLRRVNWLDGSLSPLGESDIMWLWHDGREMTHAQWEDKANRSFGFRLGRDNEQEAAMLVLINASTEDIPFTLPPPPVGNWQLQIDTAQTAPPGERVGKVATSAVVSARALMVLTSVPEVS